VRILHRQQFVAPEVWLTEEAISELKREADERAPLETGGLLLGYWSSEFGRDEVLVQRITGPGPEAHHERACFYPDAAWQHRELADVYAASGRITTYLGDWHTHPGGRATPSGRDRKTARAIATSSAARAAQPLMLILGGGTETTSWTASMYNWHRGRLREVSVGHVGDRPP
jgi:integrative and conjugative element protein (TIGR02256 family)